MNKKLGAVLGLALSLLCWTTPGFSQQQAPAGEVWSALGNAQVKRDGKWQRLKSGVELQAGDTIATGADGDVRFRLKDASYYAVVPNSWFVIDDFATRKVGQQEGGRAVFSLLRGGFRAVTGLIGKIRGDTYQVKTPVATIGVRGTEYGAYYCEECGAVSEGSQDGLHVYTYSGTTTIENEQGSQDVSEGDSGYVGTSESGQPAPAPEKTEGDPGTPPPQVFDDAAPETFDQDESVGPTPEGTTDTPEEQAQQEPPRAEPEPIASESAP
jgi:hypothetical protein